MAAMLGASSYVTAFCTQNGNHISKVGIDGSTNALVVNISSYAEDKNCNCSEIQFHPDVTDTDKILSVVLTGKMMGRSIRMDLNDFPNCNSGYRAYIH